MPGKFEIMRAVRGRQDQVCQIGQDRFSYKVWSARGAWTKPTATMENGSTTSLGSNTCTAVYWSTRRHCQRKSAGLSSPLATRDEADPS